MIHLPVGFTPPTANPSMPHPRFLCIHGHFYQPPRENPWLEAVEVQESAHPYHDWNERITLECYGPNTAARIATWDSRILDIRNTYLKISFNFGPTLLSWMEQNRPGIYEDIVEADRTSVEERGGHGNALAQPYNHVIMPLATEREKRVQVIWGLEDFRERFGRDPEGMWLPECAVDVATLECLASNGIQFTVLAPRQARAFRLLDGTSRWFPVDGGRIDPTRPYTCNLPSGKSIALFFYDGPISQAIAFEGLLNDSHRFAERLMQGFNDGRPWTELLHVATDGESYGHHHKHGEMALAYTLHIIERDGLAQLTNYGQFLEHYPPGAEVRVWENSSWSCVHGVERWKADCGCNSGMNPGWHQKWRAPLREAFRFLADKAHCIYDEQAAKYFQDPEAALHDYIHVLLSSNKLHRFRTFLRRHALTREVELYQTELLRLMEIARDAQLLFTSCAWFFDEVSGIETVQNMKYAGRLIQLLQPFLPAIEEQFLELLRRADSNVTSIGDGATCFLRQVKPNIVDLRRVVAHHALTRFDNEDEGHFRLFCHELHERDSEFAVFGSTRMKLSRISALSLVDGESLDAIAVVLHFGGHDFRCSITGQLSYTSFEKLRDDLFTTFHKRSLTDLVRVVDEYFGRAYFSVNHLFTEGRRELLRRITDDSFHRFDTTITHIYEENRKFMDYLIEVNAPLPQGFLSSAEFVLRRRFLQELDRFKETRTTQSLVEIASEARSYGVRMTDPLVRRRFEQTFGNVFDELALAPTVAICELAGSLIEAFDLLDAKPDLWVAQNIVFALVHQRPLPNHLMRKIPGGRPEYTSDTRRRLQQLAHLLNISLEPFEKTAPELAETPSTKSSDRITMISDKKS